MTFEDTEQTKNKLGRTTDVNHWMVSKQMQHNNDKTKCFFIGKSNDLMKLDISMLRINDINVGVRNKGKDLGALLDSNASFQKQINLVVKSMNCHIKNITFRKTGLDSKTIMMMIHKHVICKLDYCNSLNVGVPDYLLRRSQLVMDRAARLLNGVSPRERITPVLTALHRLPVKVSITFKMCVMTFKAPHSNRLCCNKSRIVEH